MKQVHLLTPVAGQLVSLESVHDPVFSQGMMGQGFGIEPTDGQVVAPISGKVGCSESARDWLYGEQWSGSVSSSWYRYGRTSGPATV